MIGDTNSVSRKNTPPPTLGFNAVRFRANGTFVYWDADANLEHGLRFALLDSLWIHCTTPHAIRTGLRSTVSVVQAVPRWDGLQYKRIVSQSEFTIAARKAG